MPAVPIKMPFAPSAPIEYTREESQTGHLSFLEAQLDQHRAALDSHKQDQKHRPLADACGDREFEIASKATSRHPGLSFDEALRALRATYPAK